MLSLKKKAGGQNSQQTGAKNNSGFKNSAVSPSPLPDPDDEEEIQRKRNLKKEAKKLRLREENAVHRNILKNLDTLVEDFILKYRKASIRREFPGEYIFDKSGRPLSVREALQSKNPTVRKLLIDLRFRK